MFFYKVDHYKKWYISAPNYYSGELNFSAMQIKIRAEKKEEFNAIYQLVALAFDQEDESRLIDLLRKDECFIPALALVAVDGDKLVGHILFTKISIVDEKGRSHLSLALAPMAVLPDYQRKRIGGQLIRQGLGIAKDLGYSSVIVLGHKDYYPKFGFEPAEKWKIRTHYEVPSDYFMGLALVPDGLEGVSGMVEYSPPFDQI